MEEPKEAAPLAQPAAPIPPSDEAIHAAPTDLYKDIPDTSLVSLRQFREMASYNLGLGINGLDGRSEQRSTPEPGDFPLVFAK